jgi:branched-chain amino acid transport system substrate-binding protein
MDRRSFLAAAPGTVAGAMTFAAQKKGLIRLVSSLPRTGSAKGQTDTIVNGIRLAIDEYRGEVAGFELEHVDLDDATPAAGQWDAAQEASNAQKVAEDPDAVAYIGPYNSGAAKVSMPILNEAGLVQLSPACSWPGLTKKIPGQTEEGEPETYRKTKKLTFCRVCPHDAMQAPLSAGFVHTDLKAKSLYVLDDKEYYGAGIAAQFKKSCVELGIKVLGHESINIYAQDFQALMKKIKATQPELVYFGGTTQTKGPQLAKDMATVGPQCPLMVPDGCYERSFIQDIGNETLGKLKVYATIGGVEPAALTGRGAEFVKRYRAKHKSDPEAYAVYGYEAATVVIEAVRKVGKKDREAIRQAILATKDFEAGALGKWSFDADGDTTLQQLTVSTIKDGKFAPLKVVTQK